MNDMVQGQFQIAEYSKTAAGLAELRGRLGGVVYDVTTSGGMEIARKDRRECVSLRTSLEAMRKVLKAGVLERGRAIDGEAKQITAAIEALEAPIDEQIKAEEARKAAEKAARDAIESERVAAIQNRIVATTNLPNQMRLSDAGAAELAEAVAHLAAQLGDVAWAAEFGAMADSAARTAHAALTGMYEGAVAKAAAEALAAQERAAEKAELDRLRKAEADRAARAAAAEAEAAAKRAAEEAQAKAARDAADATAKAARDEEDRKAAAARKAEQERQDKIAADNRAEADRLAAAERAIAERAQELMDGRALLQSFIARFGHRAEFKAVVLDVSAFLAQAAQ